jgi:hypothetical protein
MILKAQDGQQIIGDWKFSSLIYQGQPQPMPNPDLNLRWEFFENGTVRLYWDRKNVTGFCERFAHYTFEKNSLRQIVFAVNPQNADECGKDPDMQVGRDTTNRMEISGRDIHLYFQMGDEDLIYVLERQQ